ncbi:MAG: hypothetical protein KGJ37_05515, partial [Verrucomicrobiota bacterium]|nr:hypothetical protein [Verrucomicrobiota bacterium]
MNPAENFISLNQQALAAALAEVRALLEARTQGADAAVHATPVKSPGPKKEKQSRSGKKTSAVSPKQTPAPVSALDTLVARFGLTPFERGIVLLCAGTEFESGFAALCAGLQDGRGCATF